MSLGLRYTDALLAALASAPARAEAHPWLRDLVEACNEPQVRALLETWARHPAKEIRIGDLWIDDRFLDDSFGLPSFVKDGPGPHGGISLDYDSPRSDVIVIGRTTSGKPGRYYAIEKSGTGRFQSDIHHIDLREGTTTSGLGKNLEEFLQKLHEQEARQNKETALSPYLK